jgi:hypothetical protein
MRYLLLTLFIATAALCVAQTGRERDRWQIADAAVIRLPPTAFLRLPQNIVRELQARGCTIPQTFGNQKPHNVISGEFFRKARTDWAILCSRNRRSSILIFRSGSAQKISEIAKAPDSSFLQSIDENGRIGFSRAIGTVGRDYILKHYRDYGGPKPPPIDHQGINDAFIEKASVVHYYHRGSWLELRGAD